MRHICTGRQTLAQSTRAYRQGRRHFFSFDDAPRVCFRAISRPRDDRLLSRPALRDFDLYISIFRAHAVNTVPPSAGKKRHMSAPIAAATSRAARLTPPPPPRICTSCRERSAGFISLLRRHRRARSGSISCINCLPDLYLFSILFSLRPATLISQHGRPYITAHAHDITLIIA